MRSLEECTEMDTNLTNHQQHFKDGIRELVTDPDSNNNDNNKMHLIKQPDDDLVLSNSNTSSVCSNNSVSSGGPQNVDFGDCFVSQQQLEKNSQVSHDDCSRKNERCWSGTNNAITTNTASLQSSSASPRQKKLLLKKHSNPELLVSRRDSSSRRFASDWSWTIERKLVPADDNKLGIKRSQEKASAYENHVYENLTNTFGQTKLFRSSVPVQSSKSLNSVDYSVENIYENVCDTCNRIFSGDQCKNCANSSGEIITKKKRSLTEFFNSLKRRPKKPLPSPPRKLEIIHNVDGFEGPFKANQTFDLTEISALKEQHFKQNLNSKQPEALKPLDLTNDPLNSIYENLISSAAAPTIETIVPENLPVSPESEALLLPPTSLLTRHESSVSLSLSTWMTSLQWDPSCEEESGDSHHQFYVKHIPSLTFNEECHFPGNYYFFHGGRYRGFYNYSARVLGGDNAIRRVPGANPSSSECSVEPLDDLSGKIDCYKSEVRRNLEKLRALESNSEETTRSAKERKVRVTREEENNNNNQSIVITVKDHLYEEEEKIFTYYNTNELPNQLPEEIQRRNPLEINNQVSEEIQRFYPPLLGINQLKNKTHKKRRSPRLICRRNAITVPRNEIKHHLITTTILSISVRRTVFVIDQRALLKALLFVNKTAVRNNRDNCVILRRHYQYSIGQIIMGILTLVESVNCQQQHQQQTNKFGNDLNNAVSKSDLTSMELNIKLPPIAENTKDTEKPTPEEIYQPIWKSYTVGIGQEQSSADTFDGSYQTDDFYETVDNSQWEVAEEFEFGNSRESLLRGSTTSGSTLDLQQESDYSEENIYEDIPQNDNQPSPNLSRRICILYDSQNSLNNRLIYNYAGSEHKFAVIRPPPPPPRRRPNASNSGLEKNFAIPLLRVENVVCESEKFLNVERWNDGGGGGGGADGLNNAQMPKTHQGGSKIYSIADSVLAWKFMLLDVLYSQDEEDVMMSVPNLLDLSYDASMQMESKKLPPLRVPTKDIKIQKTNPLNPRKYIMGGKLNIEDQKGGYLHKSITGSYKKIEFGSVDNLNALSKSKSASSILSTSPSKKSPRFLRLYRPTSPRDDKTKSVIFGGDLNTLKLDAETGVPKFVTECIRLIELPENIQTNGIYRASGNKNSIETVRKKMNEKHNLRKDLMWQFLEKQDVHTLTGSLKLFFRGLSAQLISDPLFDRLPVELDNPDSIPIIKTELNSLEELPLATLKFLIKHMTVVTQNSAENLMNSSNLSICWGACIFASSATTFDSFESGNIIRKNHFVKVLIDFYEQIFDD